MKYYKCLVFSNLITIVIKVILYTKEIIPLLMTGWENWRNVQFEDDIINPIEGRDGINVKNPH